MHSLYPLVISFLLISLSELGDKTQILVLSFSTKLKTFTILLGVALGSFLSHGLAILFGSFLGNTRQFAVAPNFRVYYIFFIYFNWSDFSFTQEGKGK